MESTRFNIGTLISAGEWDPRQRIFKNTVLDIIFDDVTGTVTEDDDGNATIEYDVDNICQAVLFTNLTYREASEYKDNPIYTMMVRNTSTHKGYKSTYDYRVDRWALFDKFDEKLLYVVPPDELRLQAAPIELRFQGWLEVKHKLSLWPDMTGTAPDPSEFYIKKNITVIIRVQSVDDIRYQTYHYPGGDIPMSTQPNFSIKASVANYSNEPMVVDGNVLHNDGHMEHIYPLFDTHQRDVAPAGDLITLYPNREAILTSDSFNKVLDWIKDDWFSILPQAPIMQDYIYTADIVRHPPGQDIVALPAQDVTVRVIVPLSKWRHLVDAINYNNLKIDLTARFLVLTATAILLTAAQAWIPAAVAAGSAAVCAWLASEAAKASEKALKKARDPIEYDKNYKKRHNYLRLLETRYENEDIPPKIRDFICSVDKVRALNDSINVSLSRYMSALKKKDSNSADLQKTNCETMLDLMENEIIYLDDIVEDVIKYANERKIDVDDEILDKVEADFREKGLSESQKRDLQERGLREQEIAKIEAVIPDMKNEIREMDMTKKIRPLYDIAIKEYIESLKQVKYIRKVNDMVANDVLRELLNNGLISLADYRDRIDNLNREYSYPLAEIEGIDVIYKNILAKAGIYSTIDLLGRCKKRSNRKKLARSTGISEKLILEWANLADLMRVSGIGEEFSDMLEDIGVDTVVELSKRRADSLYPKIKKYVKESRLVRRAPSKAQIAGWIKNAKGLERMLEY
jgi:hypothetical protein